MSGLPEPACERGYSANEIATLSGTDPHQVREFMMMRASPRCSDHGIVYFAVDASEYVERATARR